MAFVNSRLSAFLCLFAFCTNPTCVVSLVPASSIGHSGQKRFSFSDSNAKTPITAAASRSSSSTNLHASVSPVVWSAVGHVLGGTTGVPIVAKAINTWCRKINLPDWTPPDRVFAPTWTVLYTAMGVAAGRVYQRVGNSFPISLWIFHYLLNLSWAPVFFGRKRLRLGLAMNLVLLATLCIIIPLFYQIDTLSGKLLLPYLAWLTFATALNASICRLNPTVDGYNNAKFQSDLAGLQDEAASYAGL